MLPTNETTGLFAQIHTPAHPLWAYGCYGALMLTVLYALDFGARLRRDYRLRSFGSPPLRVPSKAPLGLFIIT